MTPWKRRGIRKRGPEVVKADFRLAALATVGMLAAGAADAQEVINRSSEYGALLVEFHVRQRERGL